MPGDFAWLVARQPPPADFSHVDGRSTCRCARKIVRPVWHSSMQFCSAECREAYCKAYGVRTINVVPDLSGFRGAMRWAIAWASGERTRFLEEQTIVRGTD